MIPAAAPANESAQPGTAPNGRQPHGWPAAWIALATLAMASLAAWQGEPGIVPLVFAAAGTIGAALTVMTLRRPVGWGLAAVAALAIAITVGAIETRRLRLIAQHYDAYSNADQSRRAGRMAESVTEVMEVLQQSANDAATRHASGGATRAAQMPLRGSVESALLIFHDGVLVDHVGQSRVPVTRGDTGVHFVRTHFHTALLARARSADGRTEAVSVALLASEPPADRFAPSLAQMVAGQSNAPRVVFESPDSAYARGGTQMLFVSRNNRPLLAVRAYPFSSGETRVLKLQQARARTALPLLVAGLFVLIVSWRRPATTRHRLLAMGALLVVVAIAPLSALSNVSPLFDAASYNVPMGKALTSNVAALLLTSTLVLGALLLRLRGRGLTTSRAPALALVVVIAGVGPFILRDLARGITLPPAGVTFGLWIAWQLAIALAGVSILLAGAAAGQVALGRSRGLPPVVAPLIAVAAAVLAPVLWQAQGGWPPWYPVMWVAAIAALALTRPSAGALVIAATFVAGSGAVTLTWGATIRERMELAMYDLARISSVDDDALRLLQRFADSISPDSVRITEPEALLRRYASSELAMAGYPARLARWAPGQPQSPVVEIALAPVSDPVRAQSAIAQMARDSNVVEFRAVDDGPTTNLVAAVPSADGMVTTIAVPPRTRLLPADPFAALTGIAGERGSEPPYRMTLGRAPEPGDSTRLTWVRRGSAVHADGIAGQGERARMVHMQIDLRELDVLVPRGALLVLLDVAIVLIIWAATATAEGALGRWARVTRARLARSYRVRLSVALIAFFAAPAAIFASWSAYRLRDDDRAARELLLRESLRNVGADFDDSGLDPWSESGEAPYFLYRNAQLNSASDPVLDALAPLGRLLPGVLHTSDEMFEEEGAFVSLRVPVRNREALVGYREVARAQDHVVIATPARGGEFALDERREDLGILVLFATAFGVLAAMWASGFAARALARPVGALRQAALSLAAGEAEPRLGSAPASEFAPVYRAFTRMAQDLSQSRTELEAAQRRTDAVLQHVASGVMAFRTDGSLFITNPRAYAIVRGASPVNDPIGNAGHLPPPLAVRVQAFLAGSAIEESFEARIGERQLRARLTRLAGGAVLTVDDVTELASAERVLAWGEMARQVAHEIKNPLTPIRLGVQHLRRAFRDDRRDFGTILETNVERILSEIDHLDEIARAFSRYGTAPENRSLGVAVDVIAVARDVIALEQMGEDEVTWNLEVPDETPPVKAIANADELKEVVLNLLENARLADARTVDLRVTERDGKVHLDVRDDGTGIAEDVLPRIFEPHFSTRTSGSGLGLAISRRLIEGWGGTISVTSKPQVGTTIHIALRAAQAPRQ